MLRRWGNALLEPSHLSTSKVELAAQARTFVELGAPEELGLPPESSSIELTTAVLIGRRVSNREVEEVRPFEGQFDNYS
ncbi:hypothetical protein Nepgr_013288 [Nepenthes gracilis]|uniref:Uncharacterized protein n=1 Tax=Nepenthes gracilis TaxID=150966 RepID=A0AAD3SIV9_NEPGR|nr:hypothetical protein Nepgr_013288 [Nepenthes gracilis]